MRTLKMTWNRERGRLVCHWVESGDREAPGSLTKNAPENVVGEVGITSGAFRNNFTLPGVDRSGLLVSAGDSMQHGAIGF